MIWANKNGERIKASPNTRAKCPSCNEKVIAKCGQINIRHWAHKANFLCDSWAEHESEWHIKWKNHFPKEQQEVIIYLGENDPEGHHYMDYGQTHRADIITKGKKVIELQNSSLSPEEIIEREEFYGNMVWVLNGKTIAKNITYFYSRMNKRLEYRWKWFPKSWSFSNKPIYIDKGGDTLYLINMLNGSIIKLSKTAFIIKNGGKTWLQ